MDGTIPECLDLVQVTHAIAARLKISADQVRRAAELLDAGNTIPFVARYRKEATRGLDEVALRGIEDALASARELAQRKATILRSVEQQGLLTAELRRQILACDDKKELEDLYLPFKPKQRTRATIARERGLEPLAELLWSQQKLNRPRREVLAPYVSVDKGVPDEASALQGACDIVAERWSEDVGARRWMLTQATENGLIVSQVKRGKKEEGSKFEMYFDFREPCRRIASHRFLAMQRGEAEGILRLELALDDARALRWLTDKWLINTQFEFHSELRTTVEDCYQRLLLPATESAIFQQLKDRSDEEAISVFAKNLRELLLAAPAGPHVTLGIDPGFRTGCKMAVVDGTGKFLAHTTIYPTPPRSDVDHATRTLVDWIARYDVRLIAIGNGTASRETDAFVSDVIQALDRQVTKVVVSESGASIYSASEIAASEYPELDLTVRGAISIAHRLQDPLAELVKIDPKSIGVGQYQHDVNQTLLRKSLEREVESCVNLVGVDVNLASAPLLSYVAGIGPKLAERIVKYRDEHGRFTNRRRLLDVPKLGQKAFEQAAGFLRIRAGDQPLDDSAVHPESYYIVEKMASRLNVAPRELVGNVALVQRLRGDEFVDQRAGQLTVQDILSELAKPGRDPRNEFRVVQFAEGVQELSDLRPGMIVEGVVTNVTRFGAFVDVGVHQDGLIHISQLANQFVQDPSEVVSVGDIVRVKVIEVDAPRRRIALSRKQAF
ncbi:MAG: Tex family protein [Pirellulaceae bacterium]